MIKKPKPTKIKEYELVASHTPYAVRFNIMEEVSFKATTYLAVDKIAMTAIGKLINVKYQPSRWL